ncbi:hypothetical protein B0H21DRAFT_86285 [Amylocystis lapponica]|nr:hypothetical protein B0H21DRAFT_86285 [Amylocystis lapponica]
MDALLGILDRCPQSEQLSLCSCGPYLSEAISFYPEPTRLICLTKLRDLTLWTAPISISYFLAHLDLPITTSITVRSVCANIDFDDQNVAIFTSMLPRDQSRLPHVAAAQHASLFLTDEILELRIVQIFGSDIDREIVSHLTLGYYEWPDMDPAALLPRALSEVARLLSSSPIEHFRVLGHRNLLTERDWLDALCRIPRLNCLDFETSSFGDAVPLFRALSRGFQDSSGDVICPHLRSMYVRDAPLGNGAAELLIECLESRAAKGARLEQLVLYCYNMVDDIELTGELLERLKSLQDVFMYSPPREFVDSDEDEY